MVVQRGRPGGAVVIYKLTSIQADIIAALFKLDSGVSISSIGAINLQCTPPVSRRRQHRIKLQLPSLITVILLLYCRGGSGFSCI